MKLMMKFLREFSWKIVFGVISGQLFISLALRKCKKDCNILKSYFGTRFLSIEN